MVQRWSLFLLVVNSCLVFDAAPKVICQSVTGGQTDHASKCDKFRPTIAGEINDAEATKAGFHTVHSSGTHLGFTGYEGCGQTMTVQYGEFSSSKEAKRFFDWRASKASRVFTEGPKTDSKGNQVGYRAEMLLEPGQNKFAVIWTNGAMVRAIYGRSLTGARAFEKQYGN